MVLMLPLGPIGVKELEYLLCLSNFFIFDSAPSLRKSTGCNKAQNEQLSVVLIKMISRDST